MVRAMLSRTLGREAIDPVGSHDMYDEDAVLEFPQSGERFEGVVNIREWRSRYPGSVTFEIQRVRGADDIWVAEVTVSYDGGAPSYGVDVLEIRNGKIVRETVYVGEPFTAPARPHQLPDRDDPCGTENEIEGKALGVEPVVGPIGHGN